MPNIIIYPSRSDVYIDHLKKVIEGCGYTCVSIRDFILNSKIRFETKCVILNWYEDFSSTARWKDIIRYFLRWISLYFYKYFKIKIIYVMHNKCPHENSMLSASHAMRKRLAKMSDIVVILCNKSREVLYDQLGNNFFNQIRDKIHLIPLVNDSADIVESRHDLRKELNISDSSFVCVFVGTIRPYKNIELIIQLASEFSKTELDISFIIQGCAPDERYLRSLLSTASNLPNIYFIPEFATLERYSDLMKASDIALLPYNMRSSLNSGTCISVFSYGKNAVCPLIGTVEDCPESTVFAYYYKDDESHYAAMKSAVLSAYNCFADNRSEFNRRESDLSAYILENNSFESVKRKYFKILKGLLGV